MGRQIRVVKYVQDETAFFEVQREGLLWGWKVLFTSGDQDLALAWARAKHKQDGRVVDTFKNPPKPPPPIPPNDPKVILHLTEND
jgi:hypothetical protein